jgi:hypothetical protein
MQITSITFLISLLAYTSFAANCFTCYYHDTLPCRVPLGYNIDCVIYDILCWGSSIYIFDLKQFMTTNRLTVAYAGANLNDNMGSPSDSAVRLKNCMDAANALNNTNAYNGVIFSGINIDWEPCNTSTKPWPTVPFVMDIGGSVKCPLPSNAIPSEMVYDGAPCVEAKDLRQLFTELVLFNHKGIFVFVLSLQHHIFRLVLTFRVLDSTTLHHPLAAKAKVQLNSLTPHF